MSERKKLTKEDKIELDRLYEEFNSIYNPVLHHFGSTFMLRLGYRHYRKTEMNRLISLMKWFNSSYGEDYYMRVDYTPSLWVRIYDKSDINFAVYLYSKSGKKYTAKLDMERTLKYIEYLKKDNIYDPGKHYLVTDNILDEKEYHPIMRR